MRTITRDTLAGLLAVAEAAGRDILDIYADAARWQVQTKADDSPLTAADLAAHHRILAGLAALPGWRTPAPAAPPPWTV